MQRAGETVTGNNQQAGRQRVALQSRPKAFGRPPPQRSVNDQRRPMRVVRAAEHSRQKSEQINRPFAAQHRQPGPKQGIQRERHNQHCQRRFDNPHVQFGQKIQPQRNAATGGSHQSPRAAQIDVAPVLPGNDRGNDCRIQRHVSGGKIVAQRIADNHRQQRHRHQGIAESECRAGQSRAEDDRQDRDGVGFECHKTSARSRLCAAGRRFGWLDSPRLRCRRR